MTHIMERANRITTTNTKVKDLLDNGTKFKEHFVNLSEMKCIPTDKYKNDRGAGSKSNLESVKLVFGNNEYLPSDRFWLSFCSKVGVAPSVFNLYNYDEVFNRVIERAKFNLNGDIRVMEDCKSKQLLAMSDPTKLVPNWSAVLKLIDENDGENVSYLDGVFTSVHALQADLPIKIGSEDYKQKIAVQTPIDGYGLPAVYLALLRQVCSNGMVALSTAFKTQIKVGGKKSGGDDNVEFALERMFDSYSNDEGFDALVQRIDTARSSPLSVREFYQVSQVLAQLGNKVEKTEDGLKTMDISDELKKWHNLCGNLHNKYGLAHLKEMTDKQMSLLDTDLTVYEAINFITEINTHRLSPMNQRENIITHKLNGWVGGMVAKPYDLEGTMESVKDAFQERYFN